MVWGESSSILSVVFKMSSGSSEIGAAGGAISGAVGGAVGGATVGSAVGSGDLSRRPPQSLWPPRSAMMRLLFPAAAAVTEMSQRQPLPVQHLVLFCQKCQAHIIKMGRGLGLDHRLLSGSLPLTHNAQHSTSKFMNNL